MDSIRIGLFLEITIWTVYKWCIHMCWNDFFCLGLEDKPPWIPELLPLLDNFSVEIAGIRPTELVHLLISGVTSAKPGAYFPLPSIAMFVSESLNPCHFVCCGTGSTGFSKQNIENICTWWKETKKNNSWILVGFLEGLSCSTISWFWLFYHLWQDEHNWLQRPELENNFNC